MRITLADLAELAGVSPTTVSLVLGGKDKGRVSAATREKILRLARRHGYRANMAARGLAVGRTYRIAVCVQGRLQDHAIIGQFSLYTRLGGLSAGIQDAGYTLELLESPGREEPRHLARAWADRPVDGFVLAGWEPEAAERIMATLAELGRPAVASGVRLESPGLTWTDVDREGAFRSAADALLDAGDRPIVLVDIDPSGQHRDEKLRGYSAAVRGGRGDHGRELVFSCGRAGAHEALSVTERALEAVPTAAAILLTDNLYAELVMLAMERRGIRPGRDCRLIGFGDTALAERSSPRLSHYSLMVREQVSWGLTALFEQIEEPEAYAPRNRNFASELVVLDT